VPAIAISAHTESGTVINDPMNHAALIRTLCLKHNLQPLTERDRNAADLSNAYNLATVRSPSTWPVTVPLPVPPTALETNPLSASVAATPLNGLGLRIMGLAMTHFLGREVSAAELPTTIGDAYTLLSQLAKGAFGPD
jgi:phospholipase C